MIYLKIQRVRYSNIEAFITNYTQSTLRNRVESKISTPELAEVL